MVRKPMPPRIASGKTFKNLKDEKKERSSLSPKTFAEANAREIEILPPTFTEKNLETKKKVEQKKIIVGI
jgi:hypothetical protein